jgi:hypothetical protein
VTGRARGSVDLALLVALKVAVGAYLLHLGFSHVSDDDFARVAIAEGFAGAPKLDPSGTSWLPFPFWVNGLAMLAFGRSLAVARAVAFVLGALSVVPPYLAMRAVGCGRATAFAGVAIAAVIPWSAWLGVATVPESMCAGLIAAGAIAAGAERAWVLAAVGLLAAALSRYEAWPVCAVFAVVCFVGGRRRGLVPAAIALAGPGAWIAWNAYAHGDPLHFVARVAAYRRALGAASAPLVDKLTEFPVSVVLASPGIAALAAVAALALLVDAEVRRRWSAPLAAAFALLAFLVYGDVRDGAPTHHPERAALPIAWILCAFAADGLRALARRYVWARSQREAWLTFACVAGGLAWSLTLPARWALYPARGADEARDAQIERGRDLAARGVAHIVVEPCAYEHFALIAAMGAPERALVLPRRQVSPGAGPSCPRVEER